MQIKMGFVGIANTTVTLNLSDKDAYEVVKLPSEQRLAAAFVRIKSHAVAKDNNLFPIEVSA